MVITGVSNTGSLNDIIERAKRAAKTVRKISKANKLNKPKAKKRATTTAELIRQAELKRQKLAAPVKVKKAPASRAVLPLPVTPALAPMKGTKARPVGGTVPGTQIPWIPVVSSNVSDIGYAESSETLFVRFLGDGSVYQYDNVPKEVWILFQSAPSKGKFLWHSVRDVYPYQRLT